MSNGAINFFACGTGRRGSSREKQTVYCKYLNNCDDVKKNLTVWLEKRHIVLNPMKEESKIKFPLLSIMYLDEVESRKEDSIEEEIQNMGFRGLLVLIHVDTKPRRQVEDNVIQLRSENKEICPTRQNEEEFDRMMRFIQEKATMLAFSHDRKNPDSVLLDAVKFIEKEFTLHLVDVNNPPKDVKNVKGKEESPLVIFCKNDSQLQEDIENAKKYVQLQEDTENANKNEQCGSDVMLLVLTNRKNMHLADTKATNGFCMKSQLIFSSVRKKFLKKRNMANILWLQKFLLLNGYNVSRTLSRSQSFKRSFRQLRKREEMGFYEKLHNVSEEMEKSAVIYFQEKQNLSLQRMREDSQESSPIILFCRDGESAEDDINQFIEERQTKCDLHRTVVVLLRCERQKPVEIPNVPNIQRLLIHSSLEPTILPIPANGRVANKVREFLLAKRFDQQSKKERMNKEVTNSNDRQTETPKCVPKHDARGSAQDRHKSPACDTDKSSLEEKNRSYEKQINQDKKTAVLTRQEQDQEIKNDFKPALKTCMTSQVPASSKDPKINASKPSAHHHTRHPAKERDNKNEGESNTRADTKHDNQETLQAGFQGQTSSISQDTLHDSSRPSKVNDAHNPTPDAVTNKPRISESENKANV